MGPPSSERSGDDDEYPDVNTRPWILEEIIKGNCSLLFQAKLAILTRRLSKKPKLFFIHGEDKDMCLTWTIVQTKGYRGYQEDRCIAGQKVSSRVSKR